MYEQLCPLGLFVEFSISYFVEHMLFTKIKQDLTS